MRPLPWPYRVLLVVNLAYCVTGLVSRGFPAWRMFEHIADPRYELTDAAGRRYRVEDYLPRDAYNFRPEMLVAVARFACARGDTGNPLSLSVGESRFVIERDGAGCRSRQVDGADH